MRWFGEGDVLTLHELRQAGITGIVTALHHIPVGEVWTVEEIAKTKQKIEQAGMTWEVVESLPVHENIKKRKGNYAALIENYKISLANLAQQNIKIITYNFMPVLDWVRTDHTFKTVEGAEVLKYIPVKFRVFDLFILNRPKAKEEYSAEEITEATAFYQQMTQDEIAELTKSILLGLPGSKDNFTLDMLHDQLKEYNGITNEVLRNNLTAFLEAICPTAESLGMHMTVHPDDPPFSVMGLPRIVSTPEDLDFIFSKVPSPANGLCYCTGSLGAGQTEKLVELFKKHQDRIYFLHLRNVKKDTDGSFFEANHLEGDVPMKEIMKLILDYTKTTGRSIPMRPDHGYLHSLDKGKPYYPGYSFIGRLKGLAELAGLEMGLQS